MTPLISQLRDTEGELKFITTFLDSNLLLVTNRTETSLHQSGLRSPSVSNQLCSESHHFYYLSNIITHIVTQQRCGNLTELTVFSLFGLKCVADRPRLKSTVSAVTVLPLNTRVRVLTLSRFYLGVIGRLFDHLGGHPEGRAHKRVAFDLGVGELPRHAEIRQLHLSLLGQQHVGSCGNGGQMGGDLSC